MSRKLFSLDYKLQVIEEAERYDRPKKDICQKFNITPSTLSMFLKNKDKIQSRQNGMFSGKQQRINATHRAVRQ